MKAEVPIEPVRGSAFTSLDDRVRIERSLFDRASLPRWNDPADLPDRETPGIQGKWR
jgi:hypothetical protein